MKEDASGVWAQEQAGGQRSVGTRAGRWPAECKRRAEANEIVIKTLPLSLSYLFFISNSVKHASNTFFTYFHSFYQKNLQEVRQPRKLWGKRLEKINKAKN